MNASRDMFTTEALACVRRPRSFLKIKFSDCDAFGHLYNVRYLGKMIDEREEQVAEHYPELYQYSLLRQANWVVVSTDIRYLRPAAQGELVCIESSVIEAGSYGIKLEIAMLCRRAEELKAVAWTTMRWVDLTRGAVARHPPALQRIVDDLLLRVDEHSIDARTRILRSRPGGTAAARHSREE